MRESTNNIAGAVLLILASLPLQTYAQSDDGDFVGAVLEPGLPVISAFCSRDYEDDDNEYNPLSSSGSFLYCDRSTFWTGEIGYSCDRETFWYTSTQGGTTMTSNSRNCGDYRCVTMQILENYGDESASAVYIGCQDSFGLTDLAAISVSTLYLNVPDDSDLESITASTFSSTSTTTTTTSSETSETTSITSRSVSTIASSTTTSSPTDGPSGNPDPNSDDGESSSDGPNAGVIAGAVVGSLAGVALMFGGCFFVYRHGKKKGATGTGGSGSSWSIPRPSIIWTKKEDRPEQAHMLDPKAPTHPVELGTGPEHAGMPAPMDNPPVHEMPHAVYR